MKPVVLAIFLLAFFNLKSDKGILFVEGSFEYYIQIAQKENKLIFLDAYTTWCSPCKMMAKSVFTDEKVGAYFNQNFINIKIDMDTDKGIEIANKYSVAAYPTMLFINGKGESVLKLVGYHTPKKLLDIAKSNQLK